MNQIKSIYYHNPEPCQVEKMIIWLKGKGYSFISDKKVYEILSEKREITKKLAFISFDDAWKINVDLLPVIEKYNVPITIFVPIDPLTRGNYWWEYTHGSKEYLKELHSTNFKEKLDQFSESKPLKRSCVSLEELKLLANHPLVSLQAHSITHPILTNVTDDKIEYEIGESKRELERLIGKEVEFFSYPNGSYGNRELQIVSKYYKMAFTIKMRHITLDDQIYEVPRIGLSGDFIKDKLKYFGLWLHIRRVLYFITRKDSFKYIAEYEDK